MKVDVVVRTRNRPGLLGRALSSVANQSHPDLSVVVVNDGGEPGPVEEAVSHLPGSVRARTRVIHNPQSVGREEAMNTGLRAGDSPFFTIHDDDDTWEPEFLATVLARLADHPEEEAVAVRTDVVHERVEGETVTEVRREILAESMTHVSLVDTMVRNRVPPISVVYRRRLLHDVGWIDGSLPVLADWEFNLRVLAHGPMGFIDGKPLAHWHHRADSSGDSGNSVVAAAGEHHSFNTLVRDQYLRQFVGEHGSLAIPLLMAEYHHEERTNTQTGIDGLHSSINVSAAAITVELQRQNQRIDDLMRLIHDQNARLAGLDDMMRRRANTPQRRILRKLRNLARRPQV